MNRISDPLKEILERVSSLLLLGLCKNGKIYQHFYQEALETSWREIIQSLSHILILTIDVQSFIGNK